MTDERLDPITLEVVRNALASTADEMAFVMRSAYSRSCGTRWTTRPRSATARPSIVAQGLTLAVQLGASRR